MYSIDAVGCAIFPGGDMCKDSVEDARSISIRTCVLILLFCWPVVVNSLERGDIAPDLILPIIANPTDSQLQESVKTFTRFPLLELSAYRGKVIYLDFWQSSCLPCRDSMPMLEALNAEFSTANYSALGIEILAVNTDLSIRNALDFLSKFPVSYPVLGDPSSSSALTFGVDTLPTGYFIDRDGSVQGVHKGFLPSDIGKIRSRLVALSGKQRFEGNAASMTTRDGG